MCCCESYEPQASLRSAELGTHGDTNALWAKQNIQCEEIGEPIPAWQNIRNPFYTGGYLIGTAISFSSEISYGLNSMKDWYNRYREKSKK